MWEERKNWFFILYSVDTCKVNIHLLLIEPKYFQSKRIWSELGQDKIDMMTDTEELESTSQEKILFMEKEVQDKIEGKC